MNRNHCLQYLRGYSLLLLPSVLLACAPIVDGDEVGRRIHKEFERKTEIAVHSVKCPQDIESKVGKKFVCDIYALEGNILKTQVTLKDDQGDISWSVQTGLVNLGVIEENIEKTFQDERLSKVKASCDGKFKIARQGDTFECDVQEGNDDQGKVMVKVTDKQGKVNFQFLDHADPAAEDERPSDQ
ncbi:DUF4333 domain-containing protein [Acaryochloris sp. 'Moss Beach']|uniref:DUF4333 domain-containing protein n=1 Tax=Acaryochloris sp. 'Moss Beach' TaxID=2740837 RepID=UPI001F18FFA6|nr:DUF4333 domain-containing protein [Acaryochloris sp. 'Moss Beach']